MADYDGIHHAGELALNALLAFPIQMLIVALAIGTGVGVNALLASQLGQGDSEGTGRTAGNGMIFIRVSEQAVTAYGIFYKIQQFLFFAAFGLRDAITPLIAYNYGMSSLVVSILRLAAVVLPLAYWFTTFANADFIIWWAFPIAESVACLVNTVLLRRANKNIVANMPTQ